MSRNMGLLGGASGCIGRCLDIIRKHERSKPSAFELAEMRRKLEDALGAVHEVAHNLEVKGKQDKHFADSLNKLVDIGEVSKLRERF